MLADVNEKVKSKNRKGSQTDLGMTVLTLGGPDDQKKEGGEAKNRPTAGGEEGEQEEAPPAPSQKITFIYKKLPPEIATGEVDIKFVADANSGEWTFDDKKAAEAI